MMEKGRVRKRRAACEWSAASQARLRFKLLFLYTDVLPRYGSLHPSDSPMNDRLLNIHLYSSDFSIFHSHIADYHQYSPKTDTTPPGVCFRPALILGLK
jgi:hypothetical protein